MPRNKLQDPEKVARHNISVNLKRLSRGLTQKDLSELTNIPASTLSGYFAERSTPNAGALHKIADALHVDKSEIDTRYKVENKKIDNIVELSDKQIKYIPLVGTIAMGTPITAEQNIERYIPEFFLEDIPEDELFALHCKGHSMEPTIPDGAIAIIHKQPDVEDDEIAAVLVDDDSEATLKRIKHMGDSVLLMPDNKSYDPILLDEKHPGRIIGKVIKYEARIDKR